MKILPRLLLPIVSMLALVPLPAQEAVADAAGKYFPAKAQVKGGGFPGREVEELKVRLQDLSAVLAEPLLPPRGFDLLGQIRVSLDRENADPLRGPVTAVVSAGLRRYVREGNSVSREKEPSDSLSLWINSVERLVPRQPYLRDEYGPIYIGPEQVGAVGGYPLYSSPDNSTSTVLVIARPGKGLLLPVTAERVIRARIADARRLLGELEKANDPATADAVAQTRQRVNALEAELAALPPPERNGPAFVGPSQRPSGLTEPGNPGVRALVTPNHELFDRSQPASTLFVLTYEHTGVYGDKPQLEEARGKTDLKRLAALLQ